MLNPAGAAEIAILARILGGLSDERDDSSTTIELDFMTDLIDRFVALTFGFFILLIGKWPIIVFLCSSDDLTTSKVMSGTAKAARANEIVRIEFTKTKLKDIDLGLADPHDTHQESGLNDMDLLQLMDEAAKT
jgi:hypothetical protein